MKQQKIITIHVSADERHCLTKCKYLRASDAYCGRHKKLLAEDGRPIRCWACIEEISPVKA